MSTNAKQWIGIITVLEANGFLSISTAMDAFENVARNYKISNINKLINETQPLVDLESSEAFVDVVWKENKQ